MPGGLMVSARSEEYDERNDEEKAAALDAALDYEDALEENPKSEIRNPQSRNYPMLNEQLFVELGQAVRRHDEVECEIREICRRIAADGEASATENPQSAIRNPKSGRRRAAPANTKLRRPRAPREPGQKDEPWKKVTCSKCGSVTGSRVVAGKRYPTAHYVPDTQQVCPGRSLPAELVAKEGASRE